MTSERCGREVWEPRVREYQASGQTQKEWCASSGLSVRALAYWIRKLRSEDSHSNSPEWLKINAGSDTRIAAVSVASSAASQEHHPEEFRIAVNRLSIFVPFHAEDASILKLLRLLEEV